jgi:hypothetical protein
MKGLIKQKLVKNEQKEEEEARRKKSWRSGFGRSEMSLREMMGVVLMGCTFRPCGNHLQGKMV